MPPFDHTLLLQGIWEKTQDAAAVLTSSDASAPRITPALDTAIYASGDVLFEATEIPVSVYAGRAALLAGVSVLDKDDQAAAGLDLYFFSSAAASMGVRNAAATGITDSNAEFFLGRVSILTADWEDVGGAKLARVNAGNIPLVGEGTPTTSVWVIGVTRGTPTQTAAGMIVRPFIVR